LRNALNSQRIIWRKASFKRLSIAEIANTLANLHLPMPLILLL
jgi:hypothetical protein